MTSSSIRHAAIRSAIIDNLDRIIEIEIAAAALFPPGIIPINAETSGSRADIQHAIDHSLAWVYETTDGIIGFLIARLEGHSLHIVEMDVLPAFARQGIGSHLLEHACSHANTSALTRSHSLPSTTFPGMHRSIPSMALRL